MLKRFLTVAFLIILTGSGAWTQNTAAAGDFYPLQLGSKWNYQLTVNNSKVDREDQVTQQAAIDGTQVMVVQSAYNGKMQQKDYYQIKSDGIFTLLRQMGASKFRIDPPQVYLKYPVVIGESWEQDSVFNDAVQKITMRFKMKSQYLSTEKLQVPAGTFDVVKLQVSLETSDGSKTEGYRYFCDGIGLIKEDFQLITNGKTIRVVSVLTSYQLAKK